MVLRGEWGLWLVTSQAAGCSSGGLLVDVERAGDFAPSWFYQVSKQHVILSPASRPYVSERALYEALCLFPAAGEHDAITPNRPTDCEVRHQVRLVSALVSPSASSRSIENCLEILFQSFEKKEEDF